VTSSSAGEVTRLLKDWGNGDVSALNKLMPLVYDELRRMAHQQMAKERAGHTLQTTALVHEMYLRLIGAKEISWNDRAHFFALSAQVMRRVLVDYARGRRRAKRGCEPQKFSLEDNIAIPVHKDADIIALDDALSSLAASDARKAQIVELRYFGGFSVEETAKLLNISVSTVMADWKFAKVWLMRQMQRNRGKDES